MPLIKKADEMEMAINFKAMRLAWVVENLILLAWIIVDMAKTGELPFIPFMIIAVQNIIFFGSKLIMTRRMIRDHEK